MRYDHVQVDVRVVSGSIMRIEIAEFLNVKLIDTRMSFCDRRWSITRQHAINYLRYIGMVNFHDNCHLG